MKAIRRHAIAAAGMLALGVGGTPSIATAQRTIAPDKDTPFILVATFFGSDHKLSVEASKAIRERITDEVNPKQLWVIPKNNIDATLKASGYQPDSALGANDLKELAKLVRADEILTGTVTKTASGVRAEPVLMLARDVSLTQPLPPAEGKDEGAVAKLVEKELSAARKQLADNKKCENDLRAQNYQQAIADAQAGIKLYSEATLARLCLMSAFTYMKAPADSVLRVAEEILKIDPKSKLALGNVIDAYKAKGDTTKAIEASINLYRADPSNVALAQGIVNELGQMNKPDVALPIIDTLLKDNPGDPQMLSTKWKLLLAAGRYKQALAAGEEMVKADTSAATADYFTRSIAAAAADSQPQLASQIAARAVQRFPKNADLYATYAQTLRKSGQLQPAVDAMKRAVAIDPKVQPGYLFILVTESELGQADSVMATAKTAIAAGVDKSMVGQVLLAPLNAVYKEASSTNTPDGWQKLLDRASAVDAIVPQPATKFFMGLADFQIGAAALGKLNASHSCADVKTVQDRWADAQINMTQGGAFNKDAAAQILGNINQYSPNVEQAKKAFHCK